MTILQVILFFNILLALDMVLRRIGKVDWKKVWYFIKFWIPIREWIWKKIPETPNEKREEFRSKAFNRVVDGPEKIEIMNYRLPWAFKESSWNPEQIEIGKKQDLIYREIRKEERRLFTQYIMEIKPWTTLLFKIKFLS